MGLLELPTELRIHILEYLPELSYGRHETIGPYVRLTPAICRVSHTLRKEALPLYAKTSLFIIQTDDNNRVQVWLQALDDIALTKVENLQLSRHWQDKQPTRWQGHIGFYIRLQLIDGTWNCTAGTYPFANDMRGMRLESIDLLRHIVMQRLRPPSAWAEMKRLTRSDVGFIIHAMDVVASHPISSFDTEQSEGGRQRRREIWATMERKLLALSTFSVEQSSANTFYAPY